MMSSHAFLLSLVAAAALCLLLPGVISVPLSGGEEEIVTVQLVHHSYLGDRSKRSAESDMPDDMTVRFDLKGDNVELRMKRSSLLPAVTLSGLQLDGDIRGAAVYTDATRGSSMVVKRSVDNYKLTGSFVHNGKDWNLEPLHRHRRDAGEDAQHRAHETGGEPTTNDMHGDTRQPKERKDEIVNLRGENHATRVKRDVSDDVAKVEASLSRSKRKSQKVHVVEISFIADFTDYSWFESWYDSATALNEMRLWYTQVAHGINIRYDSIVDSRIKVNTKVVKLLILERDSDDDFISDLADTASNLLNPNIALDALSDWVPTISTSVLPTSDHYMFFTQFDLIGAAGKATVSSACTFDGVSINENTRQGNLAGIAAHELGHSLSAIHDVDTNGVCSDNDQFIMAEVLRSSVPAENRGNPWRFSPCSIDNIANYLSGVQCTNDTNTGKTQDLPTPPQTAQLNRDDQCRLKFLDKSTFYCTSIQESRGIENICGGMFCDIPEDNEGFCSTIIPLEYTPCGTDKFCVRGICTDIPAVTQPPPPTTQPPTTQPPTTQPPTTQPPTTQPPTTQPPTTQPPTTQPPTTQPPTTQPPTTQPPTTQPPTTQPPTTQPPTTQPPTTQPPTTQPPTTQASTTTVDNRPSSLSDCYPFLTNRREFIRCLRSLFQRLLEERRAERERRQEERRRQEEERRRQREQDRQRRQDEEKKNNGNYFWGWW